MIIVTHADSQGADNEYNGDCAIILDENLLKSNVIPIIGDLEDRAYSAMLVVASYFLAKKPKHGEAITLLIKTKGGDLASVTAMYNIIGDLKKHGYIVKTLGVGLVASGGVILLMAGNKEHRYLYKSCSIFTHDLRLEVSADTFVMLKAEVEETERVRNIYKEFFIYHTKMTNEDVEKFLVRDRYITPNEAKKLGIIDKVINDTDAHGVKKKRRKK